MSADELRKAAQSILDSTVAIEAMRKAIEDELVEWRDDARFMICGNGFSIRNRDGSGSEIIRFRTDVGLRLALRALINDGAA